MNWTLASRWGGKLEGQPYDIANLKNKINGSITCPSSFFISMINDVTVLRSSQWDNASNHSDAYELAAGDLAFIQGCINALDGCLAIKIGTIYEFFGGDFTMYRTSTFNLTERRPVEELVSPAEFASFYNKAASQRDLRQAFIDLVPSASWIDIYRSWESIKSFYVGEHRMHKLFPSEKSKMENLKRTANSFRHVKSYDRVSDPLTREEAIEYLKSIIIRAVNNHKYVQDPSQFHPVDLINIPVYSREAGAPVSLNNLDVNPKEYTRSSIG